MCGSDAANHYEDFGVTLTNGESEVFRHVIRIRDTVGVERQYAPFIELEGLLNQVLPEDTKIKFFVKVGCG